MQRRDQIRMTPDEVQEFLATQRVVNVATISPNGRPHLAPLWYIPRDDARIESWTYGSSQKVANLRRLAQATALVETGESYEQLRGVSMECDVEVVDDPDRTLAIGTDLLHRFTFDDPTIEVPPPLLEFVRQQASKRVGLVFTPTKIVSWDHNKLGGGY